MESQDIRVAPRRQTRKVVSLYIILLILLNDHSLTIYRMLSLRVFGEDICKNIPLNRQEVKGGIPDSMVLGTDADADDTAEDKLDDREGNLAGGGFEDEEGAQNA